MWLVNNSSVQDRVILKENKPGSTCYCHTWNGAMRSQDEGYTCDILRFQPTWPSWGSRHPTVAVRSELVFHELSDLMVPNKEALETQEFQRSCSGSGSGTLLFTENSKCSFKEPFSFKCLWFEILGILPRDNRNFDFRKSSEFLVVAVVFLASESGTQRQQGVCFILSHNLSWFMSHCHVSKGSFDLVCVCWRGKFPPPEGTKRKAQVNSHANSSQMSN